MSKNQIKHKKAYFDYEILDTIDAGMVLIGSEVKSIKGGRMSLEGSYVKIIGNEIFLVNAEIFPYSFSRNDNYDPRRTRKLLVNKKEILSIKSKMDAKKLTLVPLECYNSKGWIKLKVGLARGRKEYEKREKIKRKDTQREIERELRGKI